MRSSAPVLVVGAGHNIIDLPRIPAELDLAGAGMEYLPMDPFATGMGSRTTS